MQLPLVIKNGLHKAQVVCDNNSFEKYCKTQEFSHLSCYGCFDEEKSIIYIREDISNDLKITILFHELSHFVAFTNTAYVNVRQVLKSNLSSKEDLIEEIFINHMSLPLLSLIKTNIDLQELLVVN